MKQKLLIILLSLLVVHIADAREERVRFNLKFGFLKGGEAEMTVKDTIFNGKPAIHYHVL